MTAYLGNLNALLEDTCVLAVFAFLLARGRMLQFLDAAAGSRRGEFLLGIGLGLFGWSEVVFPTARAPYTVTTLIVTFAALAGGMRAGFMAALIASGAFTFPLFSRLPGALGGLLVCALIGVGARRLMAGLPALFLAFLAGVCAQTTVLLVQGVTSRTVVSLETALVSVIANGFGVFLLYLIVSDAQERALSEQRRKEIDRRRTETAHLHTLASEAKFSSLRSRIHPHFLFNTLNAIAELCCVAPERAEAACLNLSQLMRQALETNEDKVIPLWEELGLTRAYLQIEQERIGERLRTVWQIDPACEERLIIPFAIQILVENAVNHGVAPKLGGGTVTITIRKSARRILAAVHDDGVGMLPDASLQGEGDSRRMHGLQIINQQLVLRYGDKSRLRFFSSKEYGTLVVFALPGDQAPTGRKERDG